MLVVCGCVRARACVRRVCDLSKSPADFFNYGSFYLFISPATFQSSFISFTEHVLAGPGLARPSSTAVQVLSLLALLVQKYKY